MRLRHTIGAALGALALLVTIPTPAHAIDGFFQYKYGSLTNPSSGQLEDPSAQECINIPEIEGKLLDARAPKNLTANTVNLFPLGDCEGVHTTLGPGQEAGNLRLFRSVLFDL